MRKVVAISVLLTFALTLPGSVRTVQAKTSNMIRIATLAPRDTDLTRGFTRIDRALRKATGDSWGIQLYPGGIAGDEKDVVRKMRVGQMDGSIVTATGLSLIVPEVAVLNSPGVIDDYAELARVQKLMNDEWNTTFEKKGFHLVSWGTAGQLRFFSKSPATKVADIKKMRPWVWPESHPMKTFYKVVGATGVPLGVPEVYGALQTGMIDSVIASCMAFVALQWHTKLKFLTNRTNGVLVGAMVMNKQKWDSIPEDVRATLNQQIKENTEGDSEGVRVNDKKAYDKLLQRGYTATEYSNVKEYEKVQADVRNHMVGRVYPKELLDRVMKAAKGK